MDVDIPVPSHPEVVVLVSGFVSMGLEILAGRVLAPSFGSTIYTWGSIIGISLLALSLGYYRGGRTADHVSASSLNTLLLFAAGYVVVVAVAGDTVIQLGKGLPVGPRYASLLPMTVLFGPPMYLLGLISPYAAELSGKTGVGEASGHFYALGTAGSLAGAFITTFVFIPSLSVSSIYTVFVVLAIAPLYHNPLSERALTGMAILAVVLVATGGSAVRPGTVYETSTSYQDLRIADDDGVRTLYLDGQPQSATFLGDKEGYVWTYPRYFHGVHLLRDDVDDVLFIGGGGFSAPQRFAAEGVNVDVVELDPDVIRAAKQYFGVEATENLHIFEGDGRSFLSGRNKTYDAVFLDAYRKQRVPFHLTTKEFMKTIYEKTDEDGVVVSNVISARRGPGSSFARAQFKTIDQVFHTTYYAPTGNTSLAQNIVLFGSKQPRQPLSSLRANNAAYPSYNLTDVIRSFASTPDTDDVPVLRDDYAPVESLLNPLVGERYVLDTQTNVSSRPTHKTS